jgi:hypothetical protein
MAETVIDSKTGESVPSVPAAVEYDPVRPWVRAAFAGVMLATMIYGLKRMEDEDRAREAEEEEEEEDEDEN